MIFKKKIILVNPLFFQYKCSNFLDNRIVVLYGSKKVSKTYPVKTERIRDMKKILMFVIISFLLVAAIIGAGGKIYMDKRVEQKEAEKIEEERMTVEALKKKYADIESVEIEKSDYNFMTGAYSIFVKMTNQKGKTVRFRYTFWKDKKELGTIGVKDREIQVYGVTTNKVQIIYSNKEKSEV